MARYIDLSYQDFKEAFHTIEDLRDAALVATIYCGYARVGEIVRGRRDNTPSIFKEHVIFTPKHMILTIKTEKSKSKGLTGKWRKVPTSRELEGWLHEPIRRYMKTVDRGELFPWTTRWAQKHFEKWFGSQHIHLLRHWACTHCLQGHRTKKKLRAPDVARLGGWADLNTFYSTYSHITTADMEEMI